MLFNDSRVFPPVALSNQVRRHRLTSLTPGRLYKIGVSTFSGPNQRAQFIKGRTGETLRLDPHPPLRLSVTEAPTPPLSSHSPAVPSKVGNLHLVAPRPGPSTAAGVLQASWTRGDGDLDLYVVSLSTTVSLSVAQNATKKLRNTPERKNMNQSSKPKIQKNTTKQIN